MINLKEGYTIEYPWFVIQYKPCLVIYQVMTKTKSDGNRNLYFNNQLKFKCFHN